MTNILSRVLALLSICSTSAAQANVNPRDLQGSVYCLVHSSFELIARSDEVARLRVFSDVTSRPNDRHLFVFVARNQGGLDGFDIRIQAIGREKRYEIVNNATFSVSHDHIHWLNRGVGGVWTQNDFENNTRAALNHKSYHVLVPNWLPLHAVCSSYADKTDYR